MLLEYFTKGTAGTVTGGQVGCEIETDFVDATTGAPISKRVSQAILSAHAGLPLGCDQKLELGRQKIELALSPCDSFDHLLELTHSSLAWLYRTAAQYGALPSLSPELLWSGSLLDVSSDPRDQLWVGLDGQAALEELCRCSSVQFTIDVHPGDAIELVNALWAAGLQQLDYEPNNRRWEAYTALSLVGYRPDRYAGPEGFDSLSDYATRLAQHDVVMHEGQPVRLSPLSVPGLDTDLFLRSIWWHYRLRRYADTLAVEIRPLARRSDDCIARYWNVIAPLIGL